MRTPETAFANRFTMAGVCLAAAAFAGCGTPTLSHPAIGRSVAPLDLVPLAAPADGQASPELEGKVTLLNFWGVWCPPCRRELPGLARLAAKLADDPRFQLVAVSCGTGPRDDLESLRHETLSFLRGQRLDLAAWADPDGRTRFQFAATMGFSAYPTTYLIGPDRTVRQVWVGYRSRDEADMAAAVVALLRPEG